MDLTNDERRTLSDMLRVFNEMGKMSGFAANLHREDTPENEAQTEAQVRALLDKVTREGSALKPPVSVWSLFIWDGERDETLPDNMCEDETTEAYADLADARRTASEILSEVDDFDGPIEWSEDRKTASVSYWNGQRRLTVKICEIHVH